LRQVSRRGEALWPGPRRETEFDVLGLGEISLDEICLIDDLASVGRLDKAPVHEFERRAGGTIATSVLGCARLGLRCGLMGARGKDEAGILALEPLAAAGVDLSGVREFGQVATRTAVILVDRHTAARTVLFHRDPRLSLSMNAAEAGALRREEILRTRALLLDTSDPEAAVWAAGIAREAGIPVVLDADRPWPNPEALLSRVDFPVVPEHMAEEFSGTGKLEDGLRALLRNGAKLAVATRGARGALALSRDTEWTESPGFDIEPVDTTGAGDAFRAAFSAALLDGLDTARVLEFANAAGALNCLALGAQSGLPTPPELDSLMRVRSRR
jgi:sulfofructose kinase